MKQTKDKMDRRDFMKATISAIGGIIGAAIGIPAIPYIIGPAQKQEDTAWIRLGVVSKVELNVPTLFKMTLETQPGWVSSEEEFSVYVLPENGQDFPLCRMCAPILVVGCAGFLKKKNSSAPVITVFLQKMEVYGGWSSAFCCGWTRI